MQITFQNQWQFANYVRLCIHRELRKTRVIDEPKVTVPLLNRHVDYYFCFEIHHDEDSNSVSWGLVCFDSSRKHMFSDKGIMPVSLWRFRRQGIRFTAAQIQSSIVTSFRKKWWPICKDEPFVRVSDGLYRVNLNWVLYRDYLKL